MSRSIDAKKRFDQIAQTNNENIRRLLSNGQIGDDDDDDEQSPEDETLIEQVINKTKSTFNASSTDDLGRTYQYLIDSLSTGANICLVCIDAIQKKDAIWNCSCCYSPFHIVCIQKWIKDGIHQTLLHSENETKQKINWHCPKCRAEFDQIDSPKRYLCYCQKEIDPQFDPWSIPHSCGQTCGKRLVPECGHICLLLCHPGPCPPCPKQVNIQCYCNQSGPTARRCGFKGWTCGKICSKMLTCNQHKCEQVCHPGVCAPCRKTSVKLCQCGKVRATRNCNEPIFQCDKPCNRLLSCQIHHCQRVCHKNECGSCPREGTRTCPCGKTKYENLSCSEDVPTCGDTCDRKLDCGLHRCERRCHTGDCESCRQVTIKRCRCGLKEKAVPCCQEFICESKCTRMRSCGKHQCKRKCCDGNCLTCQTVCGKTLNCRNHKCLSECHQGQCYPCTHKIEVTCACGLTSITVPCGREKQIRKPRCSKPCSKPSDCHHVQREIHPCHFDECPPCRQQCSLALPDCSHICPTLCHDSVLTKEETDMSLPNTPWGLKEKSKVVKKTLPCPLCQVPTTVSCFGLHTTKMLPCSSAHPFCCGQQCNRILKCQNHLCNRACHTVKDALNSTEAGNDCVRCEEMCSKERPTGCLHSCPLTCHSEACPPCHQRLRMRCHCNSQVIHVDCRTFTNANSEYQEKLKSCGKSCSKMLTCGHPCTYFCHSGACSLASTCAQPVQIRCACKHLSQTVACHEINSNKNLYRLPCDESCAEIKKNRQAAVAAAAVIVDTHVEETLEEKKPDPVPTPIATAANRKNRKRQTNVEPTASNNITAAVTPKKMRPRRFVWTLNKALIVFALFTVITIPLTIYMFTQIS